MNKLDNLSEIKSIFIILIFFLMIIQFTAWHDRHYALRVKIPKWMNVLFFNHVKEQTVPMMSFMVVVQFYVSLVILSAISFGNGSNLSSLLFKYLFIPFVPVQIIASLVDDLAGYRKKRIDEKLSKEATLNKIHSQNKKSRNKCNKRKK